EDRVVVVGVARVFAKVTHIQQRPFSEALLDSRVVLIAAPKFDGPLFSPPLEQITSQAARPGRTRNHQVLIRGRLHRVAVADTNHRAGCAEQVRKAATGLPSITIGEPSITVEAKSDADRQVSE